MKKEYVLVFLLLLGFGVVNTMAFTVDPLTDDVALWELSGDDAQVSVSAVDIQAYGKGHVKFTLTLQATALSDDAIISIIFLNATGAEIDPNSLTSVQYTFPGAGEATLSTTPSEEVINFTIDEVVDDETIIIRLKDTTPNIVENVNTVFISIKDTTTSGPDLITTETT